jgi:hypothetical protein
MQTGRKSIVQLSINITAMHNSLEREREREIVFTSKWKNEQENFIDLCKVLQSLFYEFTREMKPL